MGESLMVPDKKGVVIPIALIAVGVTMLGTMGGVFFRAGQIVQSQALQDAEWKAMRAEMRLELSTVREYKGEVQALREEIRDVKDGTGEFMRQSLQTQSEIKAQLETTTMSLREELRRQHGDYKLLRDYTEGRISHLPYRSPAPTGG
jgi:hypothetical protein